MKELLFGLLNKYAAHITLGQDDERLKCAEQIFEMWKSASGVSEQIKQTLSEKKLEDNVGQMHRTALNMQQQEALHPAMFAPIEDSMTPQEWQNNLAQVLTADKIASALEYGGARTAQSVSADIATQLLLIKMGASVKSIQKNYGTTTYKKVGGGGAGNFKLKIDKDTTKMVKMVQKAMQKKKKKK